jgi:hypothetical protein
MAGAPSATAAPQGGSTAQAPTAAATQTPAAASVVPFLRGSGKGKYKFYSKASLTLTTATQDLGPIDVKAYDYMRSILVTVTSTANGGALGTLQADAPFNVFTNMYVNQPNGQTMYQVSGGHQAAMIQKYGYYRAYGDPRQDPNYVATGSTTTFAVRIPFELDLRDGLGSLPNKDAAAPFQLGLTLNTLANVYGSSQGTSPTFTVEAWLEAYDQPPTILNGSAVQTTPPNMNTLQRWTEQNITLSSGQFDARVRKLGNYARMFIFELLASNARTDTGWPDPAQIVLDEDIKDNISLADWKRRIWEVWGFGAGGATIDACGSGQLPGRDSGVFPYQYFCDGQNAAQENANLYLPTIESEDYLLRGSWGGSVSTLRTLCCEVLPQGNIFG